jgi:Mlc titration factor MtfA (ptsG expression regulator)
MFAALIILPVAIVTVGFVLLTIFSPDWISDDYKWLGVIPLAILIGTFVIRRGLNEWWYERFPPRLAKVERDILFKFFPYYAHLSPAHKLEFEKRLYIFRLQKQFQMRGAEQLPGDIQLLVGAAAIQFTFGLSFQKEFYPKLGMIVLYPQTFISPDLNHQQHALEFYEDEVFDCILLSVNMLVKGFQRPQEFYNSALYVFAKAWATREEIGEEHLKISDKELFTQQLFILRGFSPDFIQKYTALDKLELFPLAVELFFSYPEKMQLQMPATYLALVEILGQDAINKISPVIQKL